MLKNGNTAIGNINPTTKLDVDGQIRIRGGAPGAGKVLTSDASGLATWQTVGGTLPIGSSGATLRHNGTDWVSNTNLFHNGTNVGIGTTGPLAALQVVGNIHVSGADRTIFNRSNNALSLGTNNTSRLHIDNVGGIGLGTTSIPTETRLVIGAMNTTNEGGQMQLNAPGGSYTTAHFIDNYENMFRIMSGTNAGSSTTRLAINANGNVGIGTVGPAQLFTVFNGTSTGTYTTTGWAHASDARLKSNVKQLDNALDKVLKLRGVGFDWNSGTSGRQIGFIAQEVEQVFPEVIVINDDGTYTMAYQNLVAPVVEAIRELDAKIERVTPEGMVSRDELEALRAEKDAQLEAQQRQIDAILSRLNAFDTDLQQCCFEHSAVTSDERPVTNTADAPKLEQNQPNPFHENTTIRYYLPNGTRTASITIADLNGVQLKAFDLSGSRGAGQVLISGGAFAAGTYIYTLTVDGKVVESKRMVLL